MENNCTGQVCSKGSEQENMTEHTGQVCDKGLTTEEKSENNGQVCDKGLKSVEKSETFRVCGNRLKSFEKSDTTIQARGRGLKSVEKSETFPVCRNRLKSFKKSDTTYQARGKRSRAVDKSEEHITIRSGNTTCKCDILYNKGFNKTLILQSHTQNRTQSDDKRFNCDVCYKSFSLEQHLKVHMRLHNDDKPSIVTCVRKLFNDPVN